jgi:hypothetical protein
LAITSHNANMQASGQISDVATTGNVTGQRQDVTMGAAQPSNDATPLYVAV